MSKGSAPRPMSVDRSEFERRWAETFGQRPALEPGTYYIEIDADGEQYCRQVPPDGRLGVPTGYTPGRVPKSELSADLG